MQNVAQANQAKKLQRLSARNIQKAAFNITEGARYCGLARGLFRGLLDNGELPYKQVGSRRIIAKAVLDKWLESDDVEAGSE
jgi:excisionase family DNA binding protein